ncbi:ABC transporter ATP-binding protein [Acetivibrio ethanolgignens]|uniref:ABC transporter ATP-binding protein n=1 Tax=Acetivibrio ethanolgignens TaxID=290052 RepID=A0A0V8QAD5_9FIRM|nr:ATP-binding cassette domain-containing protein [Acetivibrio ethanolgignens]KSV57420.1 ABC transporter ATP-binding protein [Acetivibrio ethanolgignens]
MIEEEVYAVRTHNLFKDYKEKNVISNCNMNVKRGKIYCLVGQNGAGKTTLFKMLLGLTSATQGTAIVLGMDSEKDHLEILSRTGSLIETPVFYEHLSAKENLRIHLEYMKCNNADKIENVLEKVGLKDSSTQIVSTFSLGMRQRLAVARALIHEPELLILDEPVNGLDPVGIRDMRELFRELARQGITILMSSHFLTEVELVADDIGFLCNGTIVQEVPVQDISKENTGGLENYFMKVIQGA